MNKEELFLVIPISYPKREDLGLTIVRIKIVNPLHTGTRLLNM